MVSASDIKFSLKLDTTDVGYSFDLNQSFWNGLFDINGVTHYQFDGATKDDLVWSTYFVEALTVWQGYSVFSFHEDNSTPAIVAFQADTTNNIPAPSLTPTEG